MKKELIPTVIGVSLPIIMILGVMGYVFISQNIPLPTQNFVFTAKQYDGCTEYLNNITLEPNGSLKVKKDVEKNVKDQYNPCEGRVVAQKESPDLYMYDFKSESIQKVTIDELGKKSIKTGISDEGYAVSFSRDFRYYGPMDMFTGSAPSELYVKKENKVRKLNTDSFPDLGTQYDFSIIGWIK